MYVPGGRDLAEEAGGAAQAPGPGPRRIPAGCPESRAPNDNNDNNDNNNKKNSSNGNNSSNNINTPVSNIMRL